MNYIRHLIDPGDINRYALEIVYRLSKGEILYFAKDHPYWHYCCHLNLNAHFNIIFYAARVQSIINDFLSMLKINLKIGYS